MKNIILPKSTTRKSPLSQGGKYLLVPFLVTEQFDKLTVKPVEVMEDLGESRKPATYKGTFQTCFNKSISFGGLLLLATLITTPANAHKIETQKDVGATIHIEPNDAPRAGETALTWFALTHRGGKVIPLKECDCKLSLYPQPHTEGTAPLQSLPFKAVSVANYQGIPAAEITFPSAGAYELELQGTPKAGATFSPFELQFEINVVPGITPQSPKSITTEVAPQETQTTPPWLIPAIAIGAIFTGAIAFLVWRKLQRKD